MSYTYNFSDWERGWVQNDRYERMRNDEDYSIDAKYATKTIEFPTSAKTTQCDECKERFEGAPFKVRSDGPFQIVFCGTTCCTNWMNRHGK